MANHLWKFEVEPFLWDTLRLNVSLALMKSWVVIDQKCKGRYDMGTNVFVNTNDWTIQDKLGSPTGLSYSAWGNDRTHTHTTKTGPILNFGGTHLDMWGCGHPLC